MNAIGQLVACATHQPEPAPTSGFVVVLMQPCALGCGGETPVRFGGDSSPVCVTCRLRAEASA
jgi:hypothetical protein